MAEPVIITSSILTLVTFALSSVTELATTVRDFQDHNKSTRALKRELRELGAVLESLLNSIKANTDINFDALKSPLHRCGNACKEYRELVARFTAISTGQMSILGWVMQKNYLQGDMTDFMDMLAAYKSIITTAIANVNMSVPFVCTRGIELTTVDVSALSRPKRWRAIRL